MHTRQIGKKEKSIGKKQKKKIFLKIFLKNRKNRGKRGFTLYWLFNLKLLMTLERLSLRSMLLVR